MDQMTPRDVRVIVTEIKPEAVKINGLQYMLRKLVKFFTDEDYQLIQSDMERKGDIRAWDRFLDVLKCAGVDAFKEYIKVIFSFDFKCTEQFQDVLAGACRNHGLAIRDLIRERDSSDGGQGIRRLSSTGTWSSVESNDPNDTCIERSSASADRKREYFRSSSKKGSQGKQTPSSSMGSMDESRQLTLDTNISNLSVRIRRLLGERLDHETSLHKDWRRVAECINMSQDEITYIKLKDMLTDGVLIEMGYRAMKVCDLVSILFKIGRHDCVSLFQEEGVDLTPSGIETKSDNESPPRSTKKKVIDEDVTPIPESTKEADPPVKGAAKSFDEESDHSDAEEQWDPCQESFNETNGTILQLRNGPHGREVKYQAADPDSTESGDVVEASQGTNEKIVSGYDHSLKTCDQRGRSKSETKDLKGASYLPMKGAKSNSLDVPNHSKASAPNSLYNQMLGDGASSNQITVQESECTAIDKGDLEHTKDKGFEEYSEAGMVEEAPCRDLQMPPNLLFQRQEICKSLSSIKDNKAIMHYTIPMIPPTGMNRTTTTPSTSGDSFISSRGGNGPEIHSESSPSRSDDSLKVSRPKLEPASFEKDVNQFPANNNFLEKRKASQNTAEESVESKIESMIDGVGTGLLSTSPAQEEEDSETILKKETNAFQNTTGDSAESRDESRKGEADSSFLTTSPTQEKEEEKDSEVILKKETNASQNTTGDSAESRDESRKGEADSSFLTTSPAQEEEEKGSEVILKKETNASQNTTGDSAESENYSRKDEVSPSQPLPSLVDSPSLGSKVVTSFKSTFSSWVSILLDNLGYGRQPVIPDAAKAAGSNSSGMTFPRSGISRQLSSNNAVASEHSESGIGEVNETSLKRPEENFVSDSERKPDVGCERNSRYQLNKGCSALLINNFDYRYLQKLPANNFMEDLARELELCGWQVEVQSNLSKRQLEDATKCFVEKSKKKTALFYYFGHALQVHGENYILPIDVMSQKKAYMKRSAVNIDDVILSRMTMAEASVIVVDAAGSVAGSTNEHGLASVKERQNQCVLFTSSNVSKKRFIASLLARRLRESEAITSIREWIAPCRNDFEAFACSRRLMPLPMKVPSEGWNRNLFHSSNNKVRRMAFFSKASGTLQAVGNWIVNLNKDGSDLESDFNIFLKTVDSEQLAFYLFYYEGAVAMENGELLLNQPAVTSTDRPPSLALILELLSEIVLGPRVVIINSTDGDFDAKDLNADQYNLQETLLMVSSPHKERSQIFYDELIITLGQENIDIEQELLRLSKHYSFRVFNNSLFNM